MIQTLSWLSTATPATCPRIQASGSGLGPERLDHVLRDAVALRGNLNAEEGADEDEDGGGGRQHRSVHGRSPSW